MNLMQPISRPAIGAALITLVVGATSVLAQQTNTPAAAQSTSSTASAEKKSSAPQVSDTEKWIQESKKPCQYFTWGGDLRIRNEYYNNALSLNPHSPVEEQDYWRFRARVWASIIPVTNVSLNIRLTTEPREYMMAAPAGQRGLDWTEGIIDNLNLKWANILDTGLTLTAGRQDIFLGDPMNWWLVADGTPNDGSRTFYFDAARLTYEIPDKKLTFDAIGIYQYADNDNWLPIINNQLKSVTEQNEKGAILYVSDKYFKAINWDAYFMYKHDDFKYAKGDDANLYTLGAKLTGEPIDNWKYSLEGAYQFGQRNSRTATKIGTVTSYTAMPEQDVSAFGIVGRLTYLFKDKMDEQVRLNVEYETGDDPSTKGRNEGFDLLWGRWPRWSEMYIYDVVNETRVAQTGNLIRVGPGYSITPCKDLTWTIDYNALFADQNSNSNTALFSSDGKFRGHYFQSVLRYKFNPHLSGHLWGEILLPGDFYTYHQINSFFRVELMMTY
jgi:hypothetical protein